jgi:hypothetical protein
MNRIFYSLIALSFFINSCSSEEEDRMVSSNLPVLEAYLVAGKTPRVLIHKQIGLEETSTNYITIDELAVQFSIDGIIYSLSQNAEGIYVNDEIIMHEGANIEINFEYNNLHVHAKTIIPEKPANITISSSTMEIPQIDLSSGMGGGLPDFPDPIEISWDNNNDSYFVIVVKNIEENPESVIELDEDQEAPEFSFRNEPTRSNYYELQSQQFQYFGTHEVILYSILPDYASLYTDTQNSSQNLTTPDTGIENGLGIFTGINADTLYLEVIED